MRERQIEDWTVFRCLGCNTEPYALHSIKREGRVLVSENIKVCSIFLVLKDSYMDEWESSF